MTFKKLFLFSAASLALGALPTSGFAQQSTKPVAPPVQQQLTQKQEDNVQRILDNAEQHYRLGSEYFINKKYDQARAEFDRAVDIILEANVEARRDPRFQAYYLGLVERVYRLQVSATNEGESCFTQQLYEPSPLDELSKIDLDAEGVSKQATIHTNNFDFEFTVNPTVAQFINFFTQGKGRITMERGLARSGKYRAMVEQIFKEEGVPQDIIWLAQVESVWIPYALSSASAKGIWQFIPSTGARFGLRQDGWVDERISPEKATRAAARYLKFLNEFFAGDWLLAMAAYNCGENGVDRAIARCGYADFWELYNRNLLPMETRNYVPAILAVTIIAKNPEKYGFNVQPEAEWSYDTFQVSDPLDLRVVSSLINVPYETLRELNPELKRGVTPPGGFTLRLPKDTREQFEVAFNQLTPDKYLLRTPSDLYADGRSSRMRTRYIKHVVRRGETLTSVATRYGVTCDELARRNGLSSSASLRKGQKVVVPVEVSARGGRYKLKHVTVKRGYAKAKQNRRRR